MPINVIGIVICSIARAPATVSVRFCFDGLTSQSVAQYICVSIHQWIKKGDEEEEKEASRKRIHLE